MIANETNNIEVERKELLQRLKEALKGKVAGIARDFKVAPSTVSRVLDDEIDNPEILNACIKKARELKHKNESTVKKIASSL